MTALGKGVKSIAASFEGQVIFGWNPELCAAVDVSISVSNMKSSSVFWFAVPILVNNFDN